VYSFKQLLARYYAGRTSCFWNGSSAAPHSHGRNEITIKKVGKGYVWLTNMEEVVYMYRSRERDSP
jgi:quercetin dioxygenase-like cupin family protein